jgi:UDP-N-acetylmuramoylalanine--D-glutamate ligase
VYRPTGFADLRAKRVGIFGFGVEGKAALKRLDGITSSLVLVDDAEDRGLGVLVSDKGGLDALRTCDVVLKSPGIPRRRRDVLELEEHGVLVTSALNLWLHETNLERVVAVTGTKGKSTTTSLIAFFFKCTGAESLALGNLGQPPYDPHVDTSRGWLVLEVSSYQCVDLDVAPRTVVVASLGSDHLNWHGSLETYRHDKLSLTRAPGEHDTWVPDTSIFDELAAQGELGGDLHRVSPDPGDLTEALGLLGAHNHANVALALAVVASRVDWPLEQLRTRILEHASNFTPLPGRLTQVAREEHGDTVVRFVDDGLATAPLPTMAALEVFAQDPLALIVGGFDRGVEYRELATAIHERQAPTCVVAMGDAGRRIAGELRNNDGVIDVFVVETMFDAVYRARTCLASSGVVLLSPAAPSYDRYHNWLERSEDFARCIKATRAP